MGDICWAYFETKDGVRLTCHGASGMQRALKQEQGSAR
jgi:hypothetical protein